MSRHERLDHRPLNPSAAPVDQSHLAEAAGARGPKILIHDRRDVPRREGVEVEGIFDREIDEVVHYSRGPAMRCFCQCWKLRRSSPENLHCQKVAARSKKETSTSPTPSALAVSATFCVTI